MFIPIVELASQLIDEFLFVAEVAEVGVDNRSDDSSLLQSLVVFLQCGDSLSDRLFFDVSSTLIGKMDVSEVNRTSNVDDLWTECDVVHISSSLICWLLSDRLLVHWSDLMNLAYFQCSRILPSE